jgi:hypothetical protein
MKSFQANLIAYTNAMAKSDYDRARVLRDQLVNSIRVEIEMNYREFEQNLFTGRATFNTAADIAELALAGAATITHGESAKTILSAVLTAAKGARLSYDKNFFREKTTEAIIASMQAGRSRKLANIINNMDLPVQKYPFEQAWVDLVDFFYAGTVEGGLLSITTEAGSKAESGKQQLQIAEKNRLLKASAATIKTTGGLTDEISKLVDAGDQTAARAKALKVLNALKAAGVPVQFSPDDSNEQLYQKLQDLVDRSTSDVDLRPKLENAFKSD